MSSFSKIGFFPFCPYRVDTYTDLQEIENNIAEEEAGDIYAGYYSGSLFPVGPLTLQETMDLFWRTKLVEFSLSLDRESNELPEILDVFSPATFNENNYNPQSTIEAFKLKVCGFEANLVSNYRIEEYNWSDAPDPDPFTIIREGSGSYLQLFGNVEYEDKFIQCMAVGTGNNPFNYEYYPSIDFRAGRYSDAWFTFFPHIDQRPDRNQWTEEIGSVSRDFNFNDKSFNLNIYQIASFNPSSSYDNGSFDFSEFDVELWPPLTI
jgi:hypothetical protein